eukprot:TRINITY_DN27976_c0_g1_i1.p1 TRINITY_DN27976_c0_g1~~TRINITY_DN27976_c0_g1_i1.p1  ORF type:complete len:500 (+),score=96.08 TRINITY_DN27976_c0_g1_i1:80-1579(+)
MSGVPDVGDKRKGIDDEEELTIRERLDDCYCLLGQLVVQGMDLYAGNGCVSTEELILVARLMTLRNVGYLPPVAEMYRSFSLDETQQRIDRYNSHPGRVEYPPTKVSAQEEEDDSEEAPLIKERPAAKKPAAKISKTKDAHQEEDKQWTVSSAVERIPFQNKEVRHLTLPELRGWFQNEGLQMNCGIRRARKILETHWRSKHREHLEKDIYARVSKSWVDRSGVGVSSIRPVAKDVVVDKVPSFMMHRLGYHFENNETLPTLDVPAEDLKYLPREVDEYLRSMQCVDYTQDADGVMHLAMLGPNTFAGLSQWVNAAVKGKANSTFGAGDPDDITYNHKIQTVVECALGEEFTVDYNGLFDKKCLEQITGYKEKSRQFQKNPSGNDGSTSDVRLANLPTHLKHLEGTFYICGCFNNYPLFRKKGTVLPMPIWIAFQDNRWTFYTNHLFTHDCIALMASKAGKAYPSDVEGWSMIETVTKRTAKRRKKQDEVIKLKFTIVK